MMSTVSKLVLLIAMVSGLRAQDRLRDCIVILKERSD